jgi:hypothetical protein
MAILSLFKGGQSSFTYGQIILITLIVGAVVYSIIKFKQEVYSDEIS